MPEDAEILFPALEAGTLVALSRIAIPKGANNCIPCLRRHYSFIFQTHDLRDSVNVCKVVERVAESIGLILSPSLMKSLNSEKVPMLSEDDIVAWKCKYELRSNFQNIYQISKKTLNLSMAATFASLIDGLTKASQDSANAAEVTSTY